MLRITLIAAMVAAAISGTKAGGSFQAQHPVEQVRVGEYYKPSALEASGIPNTAAVFHRSPCPALNALANHGYLPRNGKDIPTGVLKSAIMDVFSMANDTATSQVGQVSEVFSLDFLSKHNAPEHDASLVHTDAYFGHDAMEVNITLANDLLARADSNGMINTGAIAKVRKDRATLCETSNPECAFGDNEKKKSFTQASLLLLALGKGDEISVEHARSFLVEEKIPSDFVKAKEPVTLAAIAKKSAELVAQAS